MNTLLFVTGPVGVGKSSFISKHFSNNEKYYELDLCRISQELFGSLRAFGDGRLADIYNQATEEAMDALMQEKIIVVEYGLSGYDDDFVALVKAAKSNGFRVEINQITADRDLGSAGSRGTERLQDSLPFERIREDLLEILSGIVECMGYSQAWERICHFSGQGVAVDFFKAEQDGQTSYFFVTEQTKYFVFDGGEDSSEFADVDILHRFGSFPEALEAMQLRIPLLGLYPSNIHDGYRKAVKAAYQKHLSASLAFDAKDWDIFLN